MSRQVQHPPTPSGRISELSSHATQLYISTRTEVSSLPIVEVPSQLYKIQTSQFVVVTSRTVSKVSSYPVVIVSS